MRRWWGGILLSVLVLLLGGTPATAAPRTAAGENLVVHYHRPAGDYAGWELRAGGATYPFAGEDSYGRFAWLTATGPVELSVVGPGGVGGQLGLRRPVPVRRGLAPAG